MLTQLAAQNLLNAEITVRTAADKLLLNELGIRPAASGPNGMIARVDTRQWEALHRAGLLAHSVEEPTATTAVTLSNAHLKATITDTGEFTLQTASGRYLLFPVAGTGDLSIRVDNEIHSIRYGGLTIHTALQQIDTTRALIRYRTPEGIVATLRYELAGEALGLSLQAENTSSTARTVAVRFLLDTQVDVNDGSPLYAAPVNVRTYETNFPSVNFTLWRGYDFWPNHTLVGEGSLPTLPNRMVFAWWPGAMNSEWDYTANPGQAFYTPGYISSPNSDSCVLLYYDLGQLSPGESQSLDTYYGTDAPEFTADRARLIEKYGELRDAIKDSMESDLNAFSALEAKYHHSLKWDNKDYVEAAWLLVGFTFPEPSKFAKLGRAAELLDDVATAIELTDLGRSVGDGLAVQFDAIPNNATEAQTRDNYIFPYFHDSADLNGVMGVSGYLALVDAAYNDNVAQIPNPLPAGYPLESNLDLLDLQIAKLRSSQQGEVGVPVMSRTYCAEFKLGNLRDQERIMAELAANAEFNDQVSFSITLTQIAYVGTVGAAKIAGAVLSGGTTAGIELVLWGGTAAIGAMSLPTTTIAMAEKDVMSVASLKAMGQLANDLPTRLELMEVTGQWLADPLLRTGQSPTDDMAVGIEQIVALDVIVPDSALVGQSTAQVQVRNNSARSVTAQVAAQIVAETAMGSQIISLAGSTPRSIVPGQLATIDVPFSVFRSSLTGSGGYDFQFYVYATDMAGGFQVLGPHISHFYVTTASQAPLFDARTYATIDHGVVQEGQTVSSTYTPTAGMDRALVSSTVPAGSDADLHVYDSQGRHVGINYETGQVEVQIPEARYSGPREQREWVELTVPGTSAYAVEMVSQQIAGGGVYDLAVVQQPAAPGVLDTPPNIAWLVLRSSTANAEVAFNIALTEIGGSQAIAVSAVDAPDLSGPSGVIPASQLDCSAPAQVAAGASVLMPCTIHIAGSVADGVYIGTLRIFGQDEDGQSVVASSVIQLTVQSVSTATSLFLPIALQIPYTPPALPLLNGDFEQGATAWTEASFQGWRIIVNRNEVEGLPTHSGIWSAWLGGDDNEISLIEQAVTVPPARPFLTYYHGIGSEDACGYDFGGVLVNGAVVDVYDLCEDSSTGGWVRHVVNLSDYAGQTVALQIRVETDASLNSNLFVDDVAFSSSGAAVAGDVPVPFRWPIDDPPARPAARAAIDSVRLLGPRR